MSSTSDQDLRKQQVEKCIEKYILFGDDSSDEEDEVISYNKVSQKLTTFQFDKFNRMQILEEIGHNKLSFIAHAVAIKFLYSPKIQKVYYDKKKKADKYFEANFDYEKLNIGIRKAAEHIVDFQSNLEPNVVESVISRKIYEDLDGFFKAQINNELDKFFEDLTDPNGYYGYWRGNLLGWRDDDELGNLRMEGIFNGPLKSFEINQNESFSTEFFTNLRLQNRLEKRKMKKVENYYQENTWTYSNTAIVEIVHKIESSFNIMYKNDEVKFGELETASYEKIYENLALTLKDIDEFCHIFSDEKYQLSQSCASLHYLLFGLEVKRNPSALIHNMMMLDLIKNGKLTWKEAFVDKYLPMSMSGAVKASRMKNGLYANYMPHKYFYDMTYNDCSRKYFGDTFVTDKNEAFLLLQKERRLTKQWLEMKYVEEAKELFDEKGDIKMEYVDWFFNTLQTSCAFWYKVDISKSD